jgi:hypothetical protein
MKWELPTFIEINMDAEIGSYQEDQSDSTEEPLFILPCLSES